MPIVSVLGWGAKAGRSQVQVHSETLSLKTKQQHKEKEKRSEEIFPYSSLLLGVAVTASAVPGPRHP